VDFLKQEYREAFVEVSEIIKLMPKELVDRIPEKFQKVIEREKDQNYQPIIKEPIEMCQLKNETILILGIIYKEFLYIPEKIKEEKKIKYNIDNMVQDDIGKVKSKVEGLPENKQTSLMIVEEKWHQKLFNTIRSIFRLRKNKSIVHPNY